MPILKILSSLSLIFALLLMASIAYSKDLAIVDHYDPILVDDQLTLSKLIELTLENYPEGALLVALTQEAEALKNRSDSWVAGALNASFFYRNSWVRGAVETGAPEIEGAIELPLWNWGQRAAGQQLAKNAKQASELKSQAIKLQVAGLIRHSLWEMALQNNRSEMAKRVYAVSEQLMKSVQRRVELGDLPRADQLLAQSELLSARSASVRAEAEQMHARKRFTTLTRDIHIPANFSEKQSRVQEINQQHPALHAVNALIERKKSEMAWTRSAGSGQTTVALGGNSQKGIPDDASVETITFAINVPFGGSAHRAPEIASANLELVETMIRRDHFFRELTEALHEAEHALEIDRMELATARQRKKIAEAHLKMIQLSFSAGEIDLLDMLKIRANAFSAIREAEERHIILQRDIALYNQVVGQLP